MLMSWYNSKNKYPNGDNMLVGGLFRSNVQRLNQDESVHIILYISISTNLPIL